MHRHNHRSSYVTRAPINDSSEWCSNSLHCMARDSKRLLLNNGLIPSELFYRIYPGFRSATDVPTSSHYKDLMKAYPGVKIILTVRDPQDWLASVRQKILSHRPRFPTSWFNDMAICLFIGSDCFKLANCLFDRMYGLQADRDNDQKLLVAYGRWNEQVKQTVPVDQLLVYDVRQGWEPLCKFLKVPIPNEPFPCVNKRKVVLALKNKVYRLTAVLQYTVVAAICFAVCYWILQ
ncbi:NAD dependent epimerase/dehydratase [Clonorchis sinensis]|uniref:NAD dependent epimerase/dehydratase n=1 Tax=Clonorchis sinensis TaxID=79923 RepID=G7YJC1_CLOSI|nr:NAD dependent epimerase/dehydratase [Clonorchis sinensis]